MVVGRVYVALSSLSFIVAGAVDLTGRGECTGPECGVGGDAFVQLRQGVAYLGERTACGVNGNNDGEELRKVAANGSCDCETKCDADPDCMGWSWAPPFPGPNGEKCSLRSTWAGMTDNCDGTCLSGENKNHKACGVNGNNYGNGKKVAANGPCDCKTKCDAESDCVGWSWAPPFPGPNGEKCSLRSTWAAMIDNCDGTCVSAEKVPTPAPTAAPTTAPTTAPTIASHNMEDCDNKKNRTGLFSTIYDAIDKIICDMRNSQIEDQKLIDKQVDKFAVCSKYPEKDDEARKKAESLKQPIKDAKAKLEELSEGKVKYDFGDDKTSSIIAADNTKKTVDGKHNNFDLAVVALQKAETEFAEASKRADAADKEKVKAKKQCICNARDAYDDVLKTSQNEETQRRDDIKLLRTVKCSIKAGNTTSLAKCPNSVTVDLTPLDAKTDKILACELKSDN